MRYAAPKAAPFSPWKGPQLALMTNFSLGSTVGMPDMAKAMATPVNALLVLRLSRSMRPLSAAMSAEEPRRRPDIGTDDRLPAASVVTTFVGPDCAAALAGELSPGNV